MLKKLLISLMILCSFAATVVAAPASSSAARPAEIEVDIVEATFTISGKVKDSATLKDVSINILYPGKTLSDIFVGNPKDAVAFSGQFHVDRTREFEVVAKIDGPTGIYKVYVEYAGNTNKYAEVLYVTKTDNDAAIDLLLKSADATEVKTHITTPVLTDAGVWQNLNMQNELFKGLNVTNFSEKYFALMSEEAYQVSDISWELAKKFFDQACVLEAIAEGKLSAVEDYLATMEIADTKTIAKSNINAKAAFTQKVNAVLKARNAKNLAEFEAALEEATVLAAVKCSDAGPIKSIITEFATKIGIESPSTSSNVYSLLKGTDCADYAALLIAYNNEIDNIKKGNDKNNNNNNKVNNTQSIVGIPLPADKSNPIEVIEQKDTFTDINGHWAKDAIMAVYGKGIISGMGDGKFAPNASVKREQFVVMITKAFGFEQGSAVMFDDVKGTDWYYSAVNAAYNNGITKGMGNIFGVGMNITREDMAVMIYNAVNKAGLELETTEVTEEFTDADQISPYAKNAVEYLRSAKVINGMGDGTFNPKGANTRAQAAVVINAVLNAVKGA